MKRLLITLIAISLLAMGCGNKEVDGISAVAETSVSETAIAETVSQTTAVSDDSISEDSVSEDTLAEEKEPIVISVSYNEAQYSQYWEEVTFSRLPESVKDLENIANDKYDDPYITAAIAIASICNYDNNPEETIKMMEYLNGTEGLTEFEKDLYRKELTDKGYKGYSYFYGATPENYYTPDEPYTVKIMADRFSFYIEGREKMFVNTSGSKGLRAINVRYDEEIKRNCVYEHGLLGDMLEAGYKEPTEE